MLRSTTALALIFCFVTPAIAQESSPEQDIHYEGEYVDIDRDVEQIDGQTSGTLNVQLESGEGLTRTFEREYDAENQSASRNAETVTNAGQSVSSSDAVNCAGGDCTRNASVTGPEGDSISYDRTVSADENGVSSEKTLTGPEGESVTQERSIASTEDGFERSASITGPEQSASIEGSIGYTDEDGLQRSSSAVGLAGYTIMTEGGVECTNSTCVRTASQTGPGEESRSVENRTTLGEYGFVENERNVTAPNGETRTQTRFGQVGRPRRR